MDNTGVDLCALGWRVLKCDADHPYYARLQLPGIQVRHPTGRLSGPALLTSCLFEPRARRRRRMPQGPGGADVAAS
jgi:hypothetical protein